MAKTGGPEAFWRCGRCGTPNPTSNYITSCISCGASRAFATAMSAPQPSAAPAEPGRHPRRRLSLRLRLAILNLMLVLGVMAVIHILSGVWWPAALMLLSPRWIWLIPGLGLILWTIQAKDRPSLIVTLIGLVLAAGPLMNLNIPWGGLLALGEPNAGAMRILSLNRGGAPINASRLIQYIERQKIDVLCFQEIGRDPVLDDYLSKGWFREKDGYLATRYPIVEEIPPPPEQNENQDRFTMSVRRLKVRRPDGLVFSVATVHMPTLSRGLNGGIGVGFRPERFQLHLEWWSKEFGRLISTLSERQDGLLLVAGDLNMPIDHPVIRAIRRAGIFQFAFEERGWGYGYTKPSSMPWIRIDHILASPEWRVSRCWIGPDFGSDHRSIVAEIVPPPAS